MLAMDCAGWSLSTSLSTARMAGAMLCGFEAVRTTKLIWLRKNGSGT